MTMCVWSPRLMLGEHDATCDEAAIEIGRLSTALFVAFQFTKSSRFTGRVFWSSVDGRLVSPWLTKPHNL